MPMFDFKDGRGPVPAHQHTKGGGWVADTARVSSTAYIGPNAHVYGHAQVYDQARVFGQARVYTVAPEEATLLTLKDDNKIKIESLVDLNLVQVYV